MILDCGTLGRAAVVRWQSAGVMGVCFDSELNVREASGLIERSNAMAARKKEILAEIDEDSLPTPITRTMNASALQRAEGRA